MWYALFRISNSSATDAFELPAWLLRFCSRLLQSDFALNYVCQERLASTADKWAKTRVRLQSDVEIRLPGEREGIPIAAGRWSLGKITWLLFGTVCLITWCVMFLDEQCNVIVRRDCVWLLERYDRTKLKGINMHLRQLTSRVRMMTSLNAFSRNVQLSIRKKK
jgi:hypothetical protein